MVQEVTGDILGAKVDAVVVPVNTVGVMGKGLALDFKNRYPEAFEAYRSACERGLLVAGRVLVTPTGALLPYLAFHFPTKRHWKDRSRIEDIEAGLASLADVAQRYGVSSIAVPALGCGLGGLSFATVGPLIKAALGEVQGRVFLFAPAEAAMSSGAGPRR
jgi:O-acetyl-ADP-ribose deacetylase (regulator of RNase III)